MSGEISSLDEESCQVKDSLSKDKQDLIEHFHEIVGNLDYNESVKIMIENKWNLEQAVHKIIDIPMGGEHASESANLSDFQDQLVPSIPSTISDGVRRRNIVNTTVEVKPFNQKVIKYSPIVRNKWYWQLFTLAWSPFQKIIEMFMYLFTAFQPDPRHTIIDSAEDVRTFIQQLKLEAAPSELPDFLSQPYGYCIADAKEKLQYLVVYLHDNTNNCMNAVKNVLCSDEFKNLIRDENLLLWGCSVQKPEGYRVAQTFRQHSYPFIGLIGMQNNYKMALLVRVEGEIEKVDIIAKLRKVIRDFEGPIVAARTDREERMKTQNLRLQQDMDYAESLRMDREKEKVLEDKKERERKMDVLKKEEEEKRTKQIDEMTRIRQLIASKLPAEPNNPENTILIRIQTPSGQLSRRFFTSDSLKMLYYVVKSQSSAPWNFQITSNFPKKTWPCIPSNLEHENNEIIREPRPNFDDPPSFKDYGIATNITVLVIDQEA